MYSRPLGRRVTERSGPQQQWTVTSSYGSSGLRSGLTYPTAWEGAATALTWTRDILGRPRTLTDTRAAGSGDDRVLADLVYAGATRLVQLTHADGTIWSAPGWDQAGRRSLAKVTRPYGGSDPEGGLVFSEELRYDVRDAVSAVIWAHGRSGVDVSEAQTYSFDDAGRLKEFTQGLWSAATGTVTGSPTARHDYTLDEQSNWREHQGRAGSARLSPSVSSINAYTNWPTDIDGNGTAEFKDPAPGDENRSIDGQLGFVWKKEEREARR